jgi:hypothetical protein
MCKLCCKTVTFRCVRVGRRFFCLVLFSTSFVLVSREFTVTVVYVHVYSHSLYYAGDVI